MTLHAWFCHCINPEVPMQTPCAVKDSSRPPRCVCVCGGGDIRFSLVNRKLQLTWDESRKYVTGGSRPYSKARFWFYPHMGSQSLCVVGSMTIRRTIVRLRYEAVFWLAHELSHDQRSLIVWPLQRCVDKERDQTTTVVDNIIVKEASRRGVIPRVYPNKCLST